MKLSVLLIFFFALSANGQDGHRCGPAPDEAILANSATEGLGNIIQGFSRNCSLSSSAQKASLYIKYYKTRLQALKGQMQETRDYLGLGDISDNVDKLTSPPDLRESLGSMIEENAPYVGKVHSIMRGLKLVKTHQENISEMKGRQHGLHRVMVMALEDIDAKIMAADDDEFERALTCAFHDNSQDSLGSFCTREGYGIRALDCSAVDSLSSVSNMKEHMKKVRADFAKHVSKAIYIKTDQGFPKHRKTTARFDISMSMEFEERDGAIHFSTDGRKVEFTSVASKEVLCKVAEQPEYRYQKGRYKNSVKSSVTTGQLGYPVLLKVRYNRAIYWQEFDASGNPVGFPLGGSSPRQVKKMAEIMKQYGRIFLSVPLKKMTEGC